jgi:hypothetical protein
VINASFAQVLPLEEPRPAPDQNRRVNQSQLLHMVQTGEGLFNMLNVQNLKGF